MKQDKEIYSAEEIILFQNIEDEKYKSLPPQEVAEERFILEQAVCNTLSKQTRKKSINVRLIEDDISRIHTGSIKLREEN